MIFFLSLNLFRVGSSPPETLNSPNMDENSIPSYPHHSSSSHNPIQSRSGQILWIRGLTRLQTQVCAFLVCSAITNFVSLYFDLNM